MNERGQYGTRRTAVRNPFAAAHVGGILFHTVGDRDALVEQVNTGFSILVRELIAKMGADPKDLVPDAVAMTRDPVGYTKRLKAALDALQKSPLYPFWRDVVSPEYDAWNKFHAEQSSWEEWKTDYSTYENWVERLEAMRKTVNKRLAELNASPLTGPQVVSLPKTVMEKGGEAVEAAAKGAAGAVGDVWSIVKWGVIGALVIGGVVALSSVAANLKKGRDPIESYRRKPAARGPASGQLALASGEGT